MPVLETKFKSHHHANGFLLVSETIPWVPTVQGPVSLPKAICVCPQMEISRLELKLSPCKHLAGSPLTWSR